MNYSEIDNKKARNAGFALTALGLILGFYLNKYIFILSGILFFLSLICPQILKTPAFLWYLLGELLGNVMSRVILTVFYFLLLLPIALLKRVVSKEHTMILKPIQTMESNFNQRTEQPTDFSKQF